MAIDGDSLFRQALLQARPTRDRMAQHRSGVCRKGIPVLLAAEQIEPLSRHQPEPRVSGNRHATGQIDRVVAAELGPVNLRMGDEKTGLSICGAILQLSTTRYFRFSDSENDFIQNSICYSFQIQIVLRKILCQQKN